MILEGGVRFRRECNLQQGCLAETRLVAHLVHKRRQVEGIRSIEKFRLWIQKRGEIPRDAEIRIPDLRCRRNWTK